MNKSRARAFTLIELLVVIAIIALLMAILTPSLQKAKSLARRAICLSNCRQWAIAMAGYASDNEDYYPEKYRSGYGDQRDGQLTYGAPYIYARTLTPGDLSQVEFNLISTFVEPYLENDQEYTKCPDFYWEPYERDWEEQLRTGGWFVMGSHYMVFVGGSRLGELNNKPPTCYAWNYVPPRKMSQAPSDMAVMGDNVSQQVLPDGDVPAGWWRYGHPRQRGVRSMSPDVPRGMCSAFNDGSASWVKFDEEDTDDMTVFMNRSDIRYYWPNPGIRRPYGNRVLDLD